MTPRSFTDLIRNGEYAHRYKYDAFGNVTSASSFIGVTINPFRFSSEYVDNETGWSAYKYRYYSPQIGRFLNRDPIEEQGGLNLYGFVGNDGINSIDLLGLMGEKKWTVEGEYTESPPDDWEGDGVPVTGIYGFDVEFSKGTKKSWIFFEKEVCRLELIVKIYIFNVNISDKRMGKYQNTWEESVKSGFGKHKLVSYDPDCCECEELETTFKVEFVDSEQDYHHKVYYYNWNDRSNEFTWYGGDIRFRAYGSGVTHEVGHMFGLADEYIGDPYFWRTKADLPTGHNKNIMGNTNRSGFLDRQIKEIIERADVSGNLGCEYLLK